MDALGFLREKIIKNEPIEVIGEYLVFDQKLCCSVDSLSNYRGNEGKFYTLTTLWHCASKKHLGYAEYLQDCRRLAIPSAAGIDRRDIINYLTGESATSSKIDITGPTTHFIPYPPNQQQQSQQQLPQSQSQSQSQPLYDQSSQSQPQSSQLYDDLEYPPSKKQKQMVSFYLFILNINKKEKSYLLIII